MMTVLTHRDASLFMRLTPRQLSTAVKKRGIPRVKFGREWRYVREDLEALMRGMPFPSLLPPPTPVVLRDTQPVQLPPSSIDLAPRPVHHRGVYAMKGGAR